jgi:hypothetical protein
MRIPVGRPKRREGLEGHEQHERGERREREPFARRALSSPRWRGAAAVAAGALPALAFPEPSLWWFAYAALVP